MILTVAGLNEATCGEIARLDNAGFSGKIEPFIYGYNVSLYTKDYEQLHQKVCKDIYELRVFLEGIGK